MASLIKEERYICHIGTEEHILRVQQLVYGEEPWPQRYRLDLPASSARPARRFYAADPIRVAKQAVKYLSSADSAPATR